MSLHELKLERVDHTVQVENTHSESDDTTGYNGGVTIDHIRGTFTR